MALAQHPFLPDPQPTCRRAACCASCRSSSSSQTDVERYLALEFPGHRFPAELAASFTRGRRAVRSSWRTWCATCATAASSSHDDGRWMLARSVPDIERELPESVRSMIAAQDRAARRARPAAAGRRERAGPRVRLGDRQRGARRWTRRMSRSGSRRSSASTSSSASWRRAKSSPDRTLTLRYRFVHVLYQNMLYASLQPTRRAVAERQGRRTRWSRTTAIEPAGRRGAAGDPVRGGARFRAAAAKQFFAAAQHAAGLFAFREAVTLSAPRPEGARTAARGSGARCRLELGLQMILGLSLRLDQGLGGAGGRAAVYPRARSSASSSATRRELFPVLWGLTLFHAIRGDLRVFETAGRAAARAGRRDRTSRPTWSPRTR